MKILILVLCGLMLLSTKGNSMPFSPERSKEELRHLSTRGSSIAYIGGPFGSKELKDDDPRYKHGIWITGGNAEDDGIHYTGNGNGLNISLGHKDPYYPSFDKEKSFALAMTFKANSLNTSNGQTLDLFSSLFRVEPEDTQGVKMNISYDGTTFHSNIGGDAMIPPGQLTNSLKGDFANKDLTIVINQSGVNNLISITFYAGRTSLGTIECGSFTADNHVMYDLALGSSDTSLIMKGFGIIVNGSLADEGGDVLMKDYFDKVGVQNTPEPGTAILACVGGGFLLYRRRRTA